MQTFRQLHQSGCFVIPNPWDRGSAIYLAGLGFKALATSSAGLGFTLGLPDTPGALPMDAVLAHLRDIVSATPLPVNADFQDGYGESADEVAANVGRCIGTGVAGLSIEDASSQPGQPLYHLEAAVERLRAARRAIDRSGTDVLLTGRAECYLTGHPQPFDEALRRLQAYSEAGADVLFAPGVRDLDEIKRMVAIVAPKPLNVLVARSSPFAVSDLAALGVRRVSVGSALARVGWTAVSKAARSLAEGRFDGFDGALSTADISHWFE
jgi:2-methylisocitrate lyase-like PEP mutase family enzyme